MNGTKTRLKFRTRKTRIRKNLITTTTDTIPGHKIKKYCGLVYSLSNDKQNFSFFRKKSIKNKSFSYTFLKIKKEAEKIGANAIIGLRIQLTNSRTLVYGTAVTV